MGIGMTRIQHVKIPVTDLRRSVAWYGELLDLVPFREFVEQGELRGAALRSPEASPGRPTLTYRSVPARVEVAVRSQT
jgi:catechol 2,3-dioxygenase-like lactoylglutathione lyase family enzyme